MHFRQLPCRLQLYILVHPVALAPLIGLVLLQPHPQSAWTLGALVLATVIFSTWKVELTVLQGRMTLTFASVCLALLLQGVQASILCAFLGAIVGTVTRPATRNGWKVALHCPPLHRIVFNACNCSLAGVLGAFGFYVVAHSVVGRGLPMVLGLMSFTAIYFAVNTLGVSLAIAFQQQLSWRRVWKENFLWTAPGYFASASAAAGIEVASHSLGIWSLLFLPPLYLVYYSYKLYMERLHLYSSKLEQDMAHIQELNRLNRAIIASLATAIDAKDRYTSSHIDRVQHYAMALARAAGLNAVELEAVATGALVHDIGKLGVPDHILGKPGKLTPEEFRRIQSHVTIGTEILSPIPFPFPVVDIVATHHERWDGLGYPAGLKGEDIPIGGRIIAIVDVFDALTSDRPYRRAMSDAEALGILQEQAGKQFDPRLTGLFVQVLPQARLEIEQQEAEHKAHVSDTGTAQEGSSALEQIRQAAAEMAAVCEVAHALAEQETLEQVSTVVVNQALALVPADTAVLYLAGSEERELHAIAAEGKYGEKLQGMTIAVGEGVAGWVASHQEPRVNASAALDIARRFSPEETLELSAVTGVPLVHGPDTLGVLAVYTVGYSVLTQHHLHVLNVLSEHTAAALQNLLRMEQQRELAYTDPLTGVANSRQLVRHLDRLTYPPVLSGGFQAPSFSVVMLDLDRFKEVNDTFGHLRGDELLREVANTLVEVARPTDVVCRYAGDEFVMLLMDAGRQQAEQVAARVREAIEAIPEVGEQVKVGTSVGVASFPDDGSDGRALLHVADQRMYEDKFRRRRDRGLAGRADEITSDGKTILVGR